MLLLWGLTLLTACSPVGPEYQEPKPEMPARWSEASQQVMEKNEAALHRWWTQFNDPVLDALITRAVAANPDLKIAETRIREARAQRRIAVAGGLPFLDIGGSTLNSRRSEHVSSGGQTQDLFQADFDAGWEVDVFGGNRRQVEAAEAYLAATVEDQRDVFVSLAAEVARSYLELRASQHRLAIARENSRTQEQTVELVRNKFQIGLGGELEVRPGRNPVGPDNRSDPNSRQQRHPGDAPVGPSPWPTTAHLESGTDNTGANSTGPAATSGHSASELLRQRPDIRSAERQLAAATATVGVATAELFPRFSLSALIGLQSLSLDTLVTKGSRFWSVGPAVRWSLFDGGTARATIEISEARRERAQVTYEKTVLSALAEAENGLVSLDRERTTQKMLGEAVRASERAVVIARGQYKAGITTFLNVLQSENALYQTQDKLAQSDQRLALNMIALYKALGGGWQNQPLTSAAMPGTNSPEYRTPARNVP